MGVQTEYRYCAKQLKLSPDETGGELEDEQRKKLLNLATSHFGLAAVKGSKTLVSSLTLLVLNEIINS